MNLFSFILTQCDRDDEVGDVARDVRDDRTFDRTTTDYWDALNVISRHYVMCRESRRAFARLYLAYLRSERRRGVTHGFLGSRNKLLLRRL